MNEKEILFSLDAVDEEYLEEAKPMRRQSVLFKTITAVASIGLVMGLSIMMMLIGGKTEDNDISKNPFADEKSDYSKIVAFVERYQNQENVYDYDLRTDFV